MKKKDYILIAKAIADMTSVTEENSIVKDALIMGLCEIFKTDNPSFNPDKFIKLCKTKEELQNE